MPSSLGQITWQNTKYLSCKLLHTLLRAIRCPKLFNTLIWAVGYSRLFDTLLYRKYWLRGRQKLKFPSSGLIHQVNQFVLHVHSSMYQSGETRRDKFSGLQWSPKEPCWERQTVAFQSASAGCSPGLAGQDYWPQHGTWTSYTSQTNERQTRKHWWNKGSTVFDLKFGT